MLGTVAGGTRYFDPVAKEPRAFFDQVNLDSGEVQRIAIDFLGHGFTQDPKEPKRAAVFEKKGPGGAIVDLDALVVTEVISASPGCTFYGHGAFSVDGASLFVVEAQAESLSGKITVRDAATLRVLSVMPTFGRAPHDCMLIDQGKTLVVTNGGGELDSDELPSVTFVDLERGALLEKLCPTNPRLNAGHIARASNGALALASAPRAGLPEETTVGGVSLKTASNEASLNSMSSPGHVTSRMMGESLSVAIHEPSNIALVTNPRGALVTFWNIAEQRLVKAWEIPCPRGVTLSRDGDWFIVACGLKAELCLVSTKTLEQDRSRGWGTALLAGSHAYLRG